MVASETAVPPLAVARTVTQSTFSSASVSTSGTSGTRATLDASSAKPAVGQPVDFMAHVGGSGAAKAKVEGAHFRVAGPGVPGNQLEAADDGAGNFRTTFTFMQSGHFEVTFLAKSDGAPVHVARTIVVAGGDKTSAAAPSAAPAQAPTAAPTPPEPQPQPSAAPPANSGKFI